MTLEGGKISSLASVCLKDLGIFFFFFDLGILEEIIDQSDKRMKIVLM